MHSKRVSWPQLGRENALLPSPPLASIIGRNRGPISPRLAMCGTLATRLEPLPDRVVEPHQGFLNLPKTPKTRGCRPAEIGQNTATASICSLRTVKKFRTRLRRIASRCRGTRRHAICRMLDPFLPVDDLSSFPRQLVSRSMLLNMRINLSEISLRSLTTLTPRIP